MSDILANVVDARSDDALSERYLVYALSTITARSLPDLRDGLKPVHRRLLCAMRLVRLAPPSRYPLADGQANFGNADGDNAAPMRYTEARLTAAAGELMAGLDEGSVAFRPTYNNEEEEAEVFPGLFPNLLSDRAAR